MNAELFRFEIHFLTNMAFDHHLVSITVGYVSCFRTYVVHKLENHQEEAKNPFKNNVNVEIEPFNQYLKSNLFQKRNRLF